MSRSGVGTVTGVLAEPVPHLESILKTVRREAARNPTMVVSIAILAIITIIAIAAPLISGDPVDIVIPERMQSPSRNHWFGTDFLGRDVYARTVHGTRISLMVGMSVAVVTAVIGSLIGLISGYMPRMDAIIMRIMDGLMAIPTILLGLALIAVLGPSLENVIIAIVIVDTPRMVRVVRGSVLSIREQAFVESARSIGSPVWRILFRHIAPNTVPPTIIQATFIFAVAILTEASLSFLGAGLPPITPSWGNIMGDGRKFIQAAIWITFFPGLFLSITVLSVNLAEDGLRDILDPRLRRRA